MSICNQGFNLKLLSPTNNATDESALIRQVVKRGLLALSLAIIVMSAAGLWSVTQLTDFYQNKVNVITEKEDLLHVMRISARERTILLYEMVIGKDPFLNDNNRMALYSLGAQFSRARSKFIQYSLDKQETDILERKNALLNNLVPIQNKIVDLVIKGEMESALKLLQEQFVPTQNKMFQVLDELHILIFQKSRTLKTKADNIGKTSLLLLFAIVFITIICAIYIIRKTTIKTSNITLQINATRQMLQKTIYELIQQKSALDSHAIVSIADKQGNITYVNDKFCEISGYSRDELIGKNHRLLKSDVHPDKFYKELWQVIFGGEVWHGQICNKCKDGSYYWVESTISPFLDDKGTPYQYISIRTDITHLREATFQAEKANRSKSLFLSSMSHELRTPLNAILGFSQLINLKNKDEPIQEYNEEILNAGKHLLDLINEILDLAKIESGKLDLFIDSYSLKEILKFCLLMIKPSADKRLIKVENNGDSLSDAKINIDEKRFKQVLLNILSNAIKYNKEKGSLRIDYSLQNNEMLYLSITDTGKGIAKNQQKNIFEPFNRAGEEGSTISGSGLGLVITKNLIEQMNGSIGFESTENEGSCFWIKVPLSTESN